MCFDFLGLSQGVTTATTLSLFRSGLLFWHALDMEILLLLSGFGSCRTQLYGSQAPHYINRNHRDNLIIYAHLP